MNVDVDSRRAFNSLLLQTTRSGKLRFFFKAHLQCTHSRRHAAGALYVSTTSAEGRGWDHTPQ